MPLVLIATGVAFVVGLTALARSATLTSAAVTLHQHAHTRQSAEAAIEAVIQRIRSDPTWLENQPMHTWDDPITDGPITVHLRAANLTAPARIEVAIHNPSFELATGQLQNPIIGAPQLSANIGGWQASRTGIVLPILGLTLPSVGVRASPHATHASNFAFITFVAGVGATGSFAQTLPDTLRPRTTYTVTFDAGSAGLADVLPSYGLRISAGGTVLVDASNAALLTVLYLGNGRLRHTVSFQTCNNPPDGQLRLELFASSLLGIASGVGFDNLVFTAEPPPFIEIIATAQHDRASHRATAYATWTCPNDGGEPEFRVIRWHEH